MKKSEGIYPISQRCPKCNCILDRHYPDAKKPYYAFCYKCDMWFVQEPDKKQMHHMDILGDSKLLLHFQCPNEGIMVKHHIKQMDINIMQFGSGVRVDVKVNCPACGKVHIHCIK